MRGMKALKKALDNGYARTFIIAAALFLFLYALAAQMNISGVWYLGGGEAPIVAPANVTKVSFNFDTDGLVDSVTLQFDNNLVAGTEIYVNLRNETGEVISSGSSTLGADLAANTDTTIDVNPNVKGSEVFYVDVTVESPP